MVVTNRVLYYRETGAICYQTILWEKGNEASARSFLDTLLCSKQDWFWASERRWDVTETFKSWALPKKRQLTHLTPDTSEVFLMDCMEQDLGDDGREITILGGEAGIGHWNSKEKLQQAITAFASAGSLPLEIIIYQPGDMAWDYVFTPSHPVSTVKAVLRKFGITNDEECERRNYDALGLLTLEKLLLSSPHV